MLQPSASPVTARSCLRRKSEPARQGVRELRLADAELSGELILRYAARPHFCSGRHRDIRRQQPTPVLIEVHNGAAEHIGLIGPRDGSDRRNR